MVKRMAKLEKKCERRQKIADIAAQMDAAIERVETAERCVREEDYNAKLGEQNRAKLAVLAEKLVSDLHPILGFTVGVCPYLIIESN